MIKITKKKINMSDELKTKINWSCKFNNRPYQIIEGHLCLIKVKNRFHYLGYFEDERVIGTKIEYLKL